MDFTAVSSFPEGVTVQASESPASGTASQAFPNLRNNNLHSASELISLPADSETSASRKALWGSGALDFACRLRSGRADRPFNACVIREPPKCPHMSG